MYSGAGLQGAVAMLELAGNQGRRQSPQVYTLQRHFPTNITACSLRTNRWAAQVIPKEYFASVQYTIRSFPFILSWKYM